MEFYFRYLGNFAFILDSLFLLCDFSTRVFFHEHLQITGQQRMWEAIFQLLATICTRFTETGTLEG